jgi:hypothetical protein
MPFILRKEHPAAGYSTFVAVTPGFENHVNPMPVNYSPHRSDATRFSTREQAERWQRVLSGGAGTVEIDSVA